MTYDLFHQLLYISSKQNDSSELRDSRDRLRGISKHRTRHLQAVFFEISTR